MYHKRHPLSRDKIWLWLPSTFSHPLSSWPRFTHVSPRFTKWNVPPHQMSPFRPLSQRREKVGFSSALVQRTKAGVGLWSPKTQRAASPKWWVWKVSPWKYGHFWLSMLDFQCVLVCCLWENPWCQNPKKPMSIKLQRNPRKNRNRSGYRKGVLPSQIPVFLKWRLRHEPMWKKFWNIFRQTSVWVFFVNLGHGYKDLDRNQAVTLRQTNISNGKSTIWVDVFPIGNRWISMAMLVLLEGSWNW